MSKKRKCIFNDDLQKEFKFIKLDGLGKDGTKVVCQQCNAHFSVSHGGTVTSINICKVKNTRKLQKLWLLRKTSARTSLLTVIRDVAAAPQTPQLGGPRPTLGAQVSLKLLFGYVTIFSSADLFTTDLNCRKKLACDIISECNVILSRRI